MGKTLHVVKDGKQWKVKQEHCIRSTAVCDTQKEAKGIAREQAIKHGQEVAVHGVNGRIREKNSYGNDPYPPKG